MSNQDPIKIAQKGGNDADLFLLDKIHEMQKEMNSHMEYMKEMMSMKDEMMKKMESEIQDTKKTNETLALLLEELKKPKDENIQITLT